MFLFKNNKSSRLSIDPDIRSVSQCILEKRSKLDGFLLLLLVFCSFFSLPLSFAQELNQHQDILDGSGNNLSFTLIEGGIPAYSFYDESDGKVYFYRKYSEGWRRESVLVGMPPKTETSIELVGSEVYVFVYDPSSNTIRVAKRDFQGWDIEVIANSVASGMATTACGTQICLAYKSSSNNSVRQLRGTYGSWGSSTISSNSDSKGKLAIAENASGNVAVAWFNSRLNKPQVANPSSSSNWNLDTISYLDYKFGRDPALAIDSSNVVHLVSSRYRTNSMVQELSSFYAKKESGVWTVVEVSNDFSGGASDIVIGNDKQPWFASSYVRQSQGDGNASWVDFYKASFNGQFSAVALGEDNSTNLNNRKFGNINLVVDRWNDPVVAYSVGSDSSGTVNLILSKDSDSDLLPDQYESQHGTSITNADSDNDGVSDGMEVLVYKSNPTDSDSDNDGHQDGSDNCPNSANSSQSDGDGDGLGDICDPWVANSSNGRVDIDPSGVVRSGDGSGGVVPSTTTTTTTKSFPTTTQPVTTTTTIPATTTTTTSTTTTTTTSTSTTTTLIPNATNHIGCGDWQSEHPEWIWCDDFEDGTPLTTKYHEFNDRSGAFGLSYEDHFQGNRSLKATWNAGDSSAGHMMRNFGRNPIGVQSHSHRDFREVYWRYYFKLETGFQGVPDKFSRATSFSASDWRQAMVGHIWRGTESALSLDPVSGVENSKVVTTKWNDFSNFQWEGHREGTSSIEAGVWYCLEARVKLNTPGNSDGVLEFWLDDQIQASNSNIDYVGSWSTYGINSIFISNFINDGSVASQSRYIDSLVISEERIGCVAPKNTTTTTSTTTTTTTTTTKVNEPTTTSSSTTTTLPVTTTTQPPVTTTTVSSTTTTTKPPVVTTTTTKPPVVTTTSSTTTTTQPPVVTTTSTSTTTTQPPVVTTTTTKPPVVTTTTTKPPVVTTTTTKPPIVTTTTTTKPLNPPPLDSDLDGLSDREELSRGTDPMRADSDGDGVNDAQEFIDGTNPRDSGSALIALGKEVCGEWNGFLGGFWNILELVNLGDITRQARVRLYSIDGNIVSQEGCSIAPGAQCDVLVHDMPGRVDNSYGRVCVSHNGTPGEVDGRMSYYRLDENDPSSFEFAMTMPFSAGKQGSQFVSFNTFQPSARPEDANNLIANWIQITNLNNQTETGRLKFYNQVGRLLGQEQVSLSSLSRQDVSAHKYGTNEVGLVEWIPDSDQPFIIRNVRYIYDNISGVPSFDTAFQVEGAKGSGEILAIPLETGKTTSVVELMNVRGRSVELEINFYDTAGRKLKTMEMSMSPKSSNHIVTNEIFGGKKRGLVTIDADVSESIVAVGMHYLRDNKGGLEAIYGVPGVEALKSKTKGSYNTFLGQDAELVILNLSEVSRAAKLTMNRSNGDSLTLRQDNYVEVSAQGMEIVNLRDYEHQDNYGVVEVESVDDVPFVSWILRRRDDFVMPVPLR